MVNNIKPFWDDEYKNLDYRKEIFNDEYAIDEWRKQGYDNDELHNNIMKDFHNNESCIRVWTTTSEQKKGIYLYDWEEKILHKTKGNTIIFTPSDYHGSLEWTSGLSIMIDPLLNNPMECKNEQLNDYLHKANEWRNKREIEYNDMGIDITRAWGEHLGE